jgi:hypothetical protein
LSVATAISVQLPSAKFAVSMSHWYGAAVLLPTDALVLIELPATSQAPDRLRLPETVWPSAGALNETVGAACAANGAAKSEKIAKATSALQNRIGEKLPTY